MSIICITSHKGGVGKTTIAVGLASIMTAHFRTKVCLLEADIYGAGVAAALRMELPDFYLNHFLAAETLQEAKTISVQDLITSLSVDGVAFDVIQSTFEPDLKQKSISEVQQWDVVRTYERIRLLLDKLDELDYDYLVIDNAPGIAALQLAFQWHTFQRNGLNVFVSSPDRPALLGLVLDMGGSSMVVPEWDLSKCALVLNRTPSGLRQFYGTGKAFVDLVRQDAPFDMLRGQISERSSYSPRLLLKWLDQMTYHFIEYDPELDSRQFAFGSSGRVPLELYMKTNLKGIAEWIVRRLGSDTVSDTSK